MYVCVCVYFLLNHLNINCWHGQSTNVDWEVIHVCLRSLCLAHRRTWIWAAVRKNRIPTADQGIPLFYLIQCSMWPRWELLAVSSFSEEGRKTQRLSNLQQNVRLWFTPVSTWQQRLSHKTLGAHFSPHQVYLCCSHQSTSQGSCSWTWPFLSGNRGETIEADGLGRVGDWPRVHN